MASTSTRSLLLVVTGVFRGSREAAALAVGGVAGMEELAGSDSELGRVVWLVVAGAAAIEGLAAKTKRINSFGWTMSMGSDMSKAQSFSSRTTQTSDGKL